VYLRGLQSFDDLDPLSKLRFSAFFNRCIKNFQGMYFAHQEGILTASLWDEVERTMTDLVSYPGVQQWWKTRKHWHTDEFASVVDGVIARGGTPRAYESYNLPKTVSPNK
jgi:hypothetical protein